MKGLLAAVCALALAAGWVCRASAAPRHTWRPAKAQLQAAKKIGRPVTITNSIGMKFGLIPAGSFVMGSPPDEPKRFEDEGPRHRVIISRPFYLQMTEVTQAQYRAVMGRNPSYRRGCDRCPVETVTWQDAREFIRRLNAREKTDKYRLPTEAEWEYACRAGGGSAYHFGDDASRLGEFAWYWKNCGRKTHPVGQKRPNGWGLYDLLGNVSEWCSDWYGKYYYRNSPTQDPKGPSSGRYRVLRGGAHRGDPPTMRSACRDRNYPTSQYSLYGFRVVRDY
jgi:formylglycine-generating enzyme required for sulfatase activity